MANQNARVTAVNVSTNPSTLSQAKVVQKTNNPRAFLDQFGQKQTPPRSQSINFTAGATTTYVMFNAASLYTLGSGETAFSALSIAAHTAMVNDIAAGGGPYLVSGIRFQAPSRAKLSGLVFTIGRIDIDGTQSLDPCNNEIVSQLNSDAYQGTELSVVLNMHIDRYTFIKMAVTNADEWTVTFQFADILNRPY